MAVGSGLQIFFLDKQFFEIWYLKFVGREGVDCITNFFFLWNDIFDKKSKLYKNVTFATSLESMKIFAEDWSLETLSKKNVADIKKSNHLGDKKGPILGAFQNAAIYVIIFLGSTDMDP